MRPTLVTPPAEEPVTLAEARAKVRVLNTASDDDIERMIRAATRKVEKALGISLMARTYRLTLDAFSDAMELPRGPVQEVVSVQYVDAAGVTQTVSTDDYSVDLVSSRNWVVRNSSASWPTTLAAINAVSVTYVAGHDELPADYEDLKEAILVEVQRMHERGADPRVDEALSNAAESLIQPYHTVLV